jgi:hypothetical protein
VVNHWKASAQSAIYRIARLIPDQDAAQRDLDSVFLEWEEADASTTTCLTLERRINDLALIYVRHTSLLPGYTNSEEYTRFERFAGAILLPMPVKATRNLIKAAIRQLNARKNTALLRVLSESKCSEDQR